MPLIELVLRTEYITLDALLKSTGLAPSGGAAKAMVAEGRVQVDGRDELRKTCKLRAGQVVQVGANTGQGRRASGRAERRRHRPRCPARGSTDGVRR